MRISTFDVIKVISVIENPYWGSFIQIRIPIWNIPCYTVIFFCLFSNVSVVNLCLYSNRRIVSANERMRIETGALDGWRGW